MRPVLLGNRHDGVIVKVVVVQGVEPHHAQHVRQPAQVRVGDKARLAQWIIAQPQQRRHINRLELRIHRHPVAILNNPVEVRRFTVHQYQLHLGVRHAQRLDHVLGGRGTRARAGKFLLAPLRGEEVVQFFIEAEGGGGHYLYWRWPLWSHYAVTVTGCDAQRQASRAGGQWAPRRWLMIPCKRRLALRCVAATRVVIVLEFPHERALPRAKNCEPSTVLTLSATASSSALGVNDDVVTIIPQVPSGYL